MMRSFFKLGWHDKGVALQAVWMLSCVRLGLRIFGYQGLRKHLEQPILCSEAKIDEAIRRSQIANVVCYRLGATCLQRSLVVWWFLQRHAIAGSLHFGLPRQSVGTFTAHAWVQVGDIVVNDRPDIHAHYAEFTSASQPAIMQQSRYHFR